LEPAKGYKIVSSDTEFRSVKISLKLLQTDTLQRNVWLLKTGCGLEYEVMCV
jgi:hypothetical protein